MLEISQDVVQQIAEMPTRHSWAARLMRLPQEKADEAEAWVIQWIQKTIEDNVREELQENVERIIRTVWLHLLENEAIAAYLEANPQMQGAIPIVDDIPTALYIAQMEMGGMVSEAEREEAAYFLDLLDTQEMRPSPEELDALAS
jgi:hypothetical protein